MRRWVMLAVIALLAAACADEVPTLGADGSRQDTPGEDLPFDEGDDDGETAEDSVPRESVGERQLPKPPDEAAPGAPPATGEVPADLMDLILADAAERTGEPVSAFEVIRAQFVEWPDGSLGCPEPGGLYTQAIEPGYWVELQAEDAVFDYRATARGWFKLCPTSLDGLRLEHPDPGSRSGSGGDGTTGPDDR